ncbi:MAG: hypothetical protein KGZ39_05140 [Simkania sp.]|nr:hypothetical protein [Simkania sp.]
MHAIQTLPPTISINHRLDLLPRHLCSVDRTTQWIVATFFQTASYLTDPICKSHEFFLRLYVIDALHPTATKISNLVRKCFLVTGLVGYASLAVLTTIPGIALRSFASCLQKEPFLYYKEGTPEKPLSSDRKFSLLSWNVCCVSGGYTISDGGVMPWSFRIDGIINKIIETNADVVCLYEVFDTHAAFYIREKLKTRYPNMIINIGPQAMGVSSGILVASKYALKNPEFQLFPQDTLVGRTKHAAKGVFSFNLLNRGKSFANINATHLQHSEECNYPSSEEKASRRAQIRIIMENICRKNQKLPTVLTGDWNLDDVEYKSLSLHHILQKGDRYKDPKRTWPGDLFCANLMGKRSSTALNFDHTGIKRGTARAISTSLVETGYDPTQFKREALSDHLGPLSEITV